MATAADPGKDDAARSPSAGFGQAYLRATRCGGVGRNISLAFHQGDKFRRFQRLDFQQLLGDRFQLIAMVVRMVSRQLWAESMIRRTSVSICSAIASE
jgi:hypothetical protein